MEYCYPSWLYPVNTPYIFWSIIPPNLYWAEMCNIDPVLRWQMFSMNANRVWIHPQIERSKTDFVDDKVKDKNLIFFSLKLHWKKK